MARVLLLYHSYDDQTSRIARRIAETLREARHDVTVHRFGGPGSLETVRNYEAVLVGAAVRYGHHDRALEKEAREHANDLAARPNAFFSVCLAATRNSTEAQGYVQGFQRRTGWTPQVTMSFAGALQYSRYGLLRKLLMRAISGFAGGATDTSRDYEYTDWVAVDRFARDFADRLAPQPAARAAA